MEAAVQNFKRAFQKPVRPQSRSSSEITFMHINQWQQFIFVAHFWFIFLGSLSSFRTSTNSQVSKLTLSGSESVILRETSTNGASDEEEGQPRRAMDNEKEGVQYSYAMFHFMLGLASLYIMMTVTGWYR